MSSSPACNAGQVFSEEGMIVDAGAVAEPPCRSWRGMRVFFRSISRLKNIDKTADIPRLGHMAGGKPFMHPQQ